jgi:hypothetical protein
MYQLIFNLEFQYLSVGASYLGASATYPGASATYWGSNQNKTKLSPAEALPNFGKNAHLLENR